MIPVVVGIAIDKGHFFMGLRPTKTGDIWEFPGGKVEANEGNEAALVREFEEELGEKISVSRYLLSLDWKYSEKSVALSFYLVKFESLRFPSLPKKFEAHRAFHWFSLEELKNVKTFEANQRVIEFVINSSTSFVETID